MSQSDPAPEADVPAAERLSVLAHPSSKARKPEKPKKSAPKATREAAAPAKLERFLPTERITFRRQLDLLRGYAAATNGGQKPVTNKEVAAFVEMTESTTSLANAFFIQSGFLTKGASGLMPSPEVVAFQRAHQWDAATATHKLAPLVARAWFGQTLLQRLQMNALDEDKAIQVLAETANAEPKHRVNLRILLEYMEAAGLVTREGTQIRMSRNASDITQSPEEEHMPTPAPAGAAPMEPAVPMETGGFPGAGVQTNFNQLASGVIQFNINVRVDLKEISGWRPDRIAAFFSGIAQVVAAKGTLEKTTTET